MQSSTPFATPRVRLERAGDGQLSWGWLPFLGTGVARLRLPKSETANIGDRYTVQVQGSLRVTTFLGEVVSMEDGETHLRVLGQVRCTSPTETPRTTTQSLQGLIRFGEWETLGEVVDASERGAGLLMPMAVSPGVRVAIEVATEHGPLEVAGEARYCRPLDAPSGQFRVGVQFEPASHGVAAQWALLIGQDGNRRRVA